MIEHRFGVLNAIWERVDFTGGFVEPLVSRDELLGRAEERTCEGWLYPGTTRSYNYPRGWMGPEEPPKELLEFVPGSERPAFLWMLPPTHRFGINLKEDPDRFIAGVFMNFLAWIYGGRVQFEDWRVDLRHPILKPAVSEPFYTRLSELAPLLSKVADRIRSATPKERQAWFNLLALRTRIRSYEWPWERFTWTYTALDACWRLLYERKAVGANEKREPGHSRRLELLVKDLQIAEELSGDTDRTTIKNLRNNLIHEGEWSGQLLGHGETTDAWYAMLKLLALVDRLILHVIDVPCEFRTMPWNRKVSLPFLLGIHS